MTRQSVSRETLIVVLLVSLSVFALALLSPAIFNDGDTYWHVRAGQWMLSHRAVLDRDPFSLALLGKPWETQEWLSEIALAAAFLCFGWSGVAVLTGLAMGSAVILLGLFLAKRLDALSCAVALLLAASCVMPNYLARPHILALPFMTAWIVGLANAATARRSPSWSLLAVMTVWANLHGSFVFGLALLLPFGLEAAMADQSRRGRTAGTWALFAVAAVAATLLNPRGANGLLYPFWLMQLHSLSSIGEWQSLDFHVVNPVEIALFATVFFAMWRGVRIPAVRLIVLLGLAHLSFAHARYGMLLGFTGAILLADPLAAALSGPPGTAGASLAARRRPALPAQHLQFATFALVVLFCTIIRVIHPLARREGPESPMSALVAVPAQLAAKPVFNNYAFGGLLIFDGVRPLVDSRADLYGDEYLKDYWQAVTADKATVDRLFEKYRVAWTILAPTDPLVATMDHRPGWHRLFTDSFAVVHVGPGYLKIVHDRQASAARY